MVGGMADYQSAGNAGGVEVPIPQLIPPSVHSSLRSLQIGVTPMIGVNDVESEVFRQADARQVGAWAAATPWVRWTAFWSVGRDNYDPAATSVSSSSSSIQQQPWEFTSIFKSYAGA